MFAADSTDDAASDSDDKFFIPRKTTKSVSCVCYSQPQIEKASFIGQYINKAIWEEDSSDKSQDSYKKHSQKQENHPKPPPKLRKAKSKHQEMIEPMMDVNQNIYKPSLVNGECSELHFKRYRRHTYDYGSAVTPYKPCSTSTCDESVFTGSTRTSVEDLADEDWRFRSWSLEEKESEPKIKDGITRNRSRSLTPLQRQQSMEMMDGLLREIYYERRATMFNTSSISDTDTGATSTDHVPPRTTDLQCSKIHRRSRLGRKSKYYILQINSQLPINDICSENILVYVY